MSHLWQTKERRRSDPWAPARSSPAAQRDERRASLWPGPDPLVGQPSAVAGPGPVEPEAAGQLLQYWVTPATAKSPQTITAPPPSRGSAVSYPAAASRIDARRGPADGNLAHGASTNALASLQSSLSPLEQAQHDVAWSRIAGNADALWPMPSNESGAGERSARLPFWERIMQAFGPLHDLSNLDVHVGGAAGEESDGMGALAFVLGNRMVFRESPDLFTAAHEAAHVVQQRAGLLAGRAAYEEYEHAADRVADRVVRGESAADLLPQPTGTSGSSVVQCKLSTAFLGPGWEAVNERGIVYQANGANIRERPIKDDTPDSKLLPINTHVQIIKHNPSSRWYFVSTDQGELGYVADWLIWRHLPEPDALIHKFQSGETPLGVAKREYKGDFNRWGSDKRYVVNALVYVNSKANHNGPGKAGIFKPHGNHEHWAESQATADTYIWIPSVNYLNSIWGTVSKAGGGTGSISYDLFTAAADQLGDWTVLPAYAGGLVHGFIASISDAIQGLVDLVVSIFNGEIIEVLKAIWHKLEKLKWSDIENAVESWWLSWRDRLFSENGFVRGHAWGYLVGYLIGEIALIYIGGEALQALKESKLLGRVGTFIRESKAVQRIESGINKLRRAGGESAELIEEASEKIKRRVGKAEGVLADLSSAPSYASDVVKKYWSKFSPLARQQYLEAQQALEQGTVLVRRMSTGERQAILNFQLGEATLDDVFIKGTEGNRAFRIDAKYVFSKQARDQAIGLYDEVLEVELKGELRDMLRRELAPDVLGPGVKMPPELKFAPRFKLEEQGYTILIPKSRWSDFSAFIK